MIITLVSVMSVNGKITRVNESNVYSWTSQEDRTNFNDLKKMSTAIIMGRKTFELNKDKIKLTPKTLRLVITHHPEKYVGLSVPGQLEFFNGQPQEIIKHLESRGHSTALLVGGAELNGEFFKNKLVDNLILTIEPIMFGQGIDFLDKSFGDINLRLKNVKQINQRGTLVCEYLVDTS